MLQTVASTLGGQKGSASNPEEAAARRRMTHEFERLVQVSRAYPGCGEFLKPLSLKILQMAAAHDPIVILIAVEGNAALKEDSASVGSEARIWESSIVDALGLKKLQGRARPRIWWIPTGRFFHLPVHAAGVYSGLSSPSLPDFVVSSYSPNIEKLVDARERSAPWLHKTAPKMLLVTQPDIPGYPPLPTTVAEAEQIAQIVPLSAFTLDACPQASILHLACHGQQNLGDALESGFILPDGKSTISSLSDVEQPDEVISLSAAMIFSGFKSVIGTMWAMNDADGPVVARHVYEALLTGKETLDSDSIPYALDAATAAETIWQLFRRMGYLHPRGHITEWQSLQ
ncbi:hypothetical protein PUNSTDRAFT_133277 [Punctularia strigosozonata HHB-11173 SS5]|uniref:uncharacterized protein n=1 Tax=Punctularia strigosozonata (strain HHB-11173) TaxID=741275 RepID=UPI000441699C|nr:uncharacterized protein PUNSTDRAFT_133277 [Punctularia strigosozonata HHB-11173 SS5]EIN09485.1 hypothetical protein PUNSTDRAFT_133277 [Punctularia strigosozonata HHB-11173 SS5]